jgi:type I restriction enzyme R subunit
MAAILPYEVLAWEKLFWFLKFLIPKLIIKTKEDDLIDELLESVVLYTYGVERTKLNHTIILDEADTALDSQNPNLRGVHGDESEKNPLDEIIKTFNERWFHGWEATPEDQRIKFLSLSKHIQAHPDYQTKVANNQDSQNRDLAFKKILDEVMSQRRRQDLELYKLYAKDEAFQQAFLDTMKRMAETSGV